ncbi:MAG: NAD(+)/NADH kinase [Acidobacteriota bacterium]|jgi:NAD+ kinase|nr:NAD(+)/NADH kinase [Acidobacteriota bacterium]
MPFPPDQVGIIAKPHPQALPYIRASIEACASHNVPCLLGEQAARLLGRSDGFERNKLAAECGMIIVIGGDGTFLSIAPAAVRYGVPVAGFNLGTLGFLTELGTDSIRASLDALLTTGMRVSERKVLRVEFAGAQYLALNDVVTSKGNIARIIQLQLAVNHTHITQIRADGLIISTPTGSTAYSLSAGGPIVNPEVNALVVTPICPHSLNLRPLVIPDGLMLTVARDDSDNEVFVTIDGQKVMPMKTGQIIQVSVDEKRLKMIESPEMNYFRLLAEKLNWGFHK